MLTDNEKKIIRLLIEVKPDADYMAQLGSDDKFALAEIAEKVPVILELKKGTIANHEQHKEFIEKELVKLYSEVAILTNSEAI